MSQNLKGNVDDSDEEEDDDNGGDNTEKREKRRLVFGGKCSYKSAKKVVLSPFNKFDKFYKKYKRSSSSTTNLFSNHNNSIINSSRVGSKYSCYLCMSNPQTLDTDTEETDPNDSNVSCEYIKSLIEQNDFYCKECSTHF